MGYRVLADATMLLHFAVLTYIVFGGFLAWWRPRLIVPHVLFAAWGLLSITVGVECPLTLVEDWARRNAGQQGLSRGFIDTYLTGVIYPQEHLLTFQLLMISIVLVSWLGLAVRVRSARRRKLSDGRPPDGPAPVGGAASRPPRSAG